MSTDVGEAGMPETDHTQEQLVAEMAILRQRIATLEAAEASRQQAERALQQAHEILERRVAERTAALQRVNEQLQAEIAERRRVETALRSSEAHFGVLVQHASDIIALITLEGAVQYYSPAMQRVLGYNPEELIGRHIFGAFHPDDVPAVRELIADLVKHPGTTQTVEYRVRHRDGSWRHFEAVGSYPCDERSAGCLLVNARDITERKQVERALRASEELNCRIVEAVPGGIAHISREGRILHANAEAQRILGLSYDALTQRFLGDFAALTIWEDGSPCAVEDYPVTKCLATCEPQPGATIGVRRPDGTIAWAVFSAIPLFDPITDEAMGAVVTFLDITERKHAEAERQRLQAQLHQMQKMDAVGTLTGGIAHEFNNSLAAILGFTELAMSQVSFAGAVPQYLQHIYSAGIRAKELVQQMLTFSQPQDHEREPLRVSQIIQEALEHLRAMLPAAIELRQQIAPEAGLVVANTNQIHQVLIHLCANAAYAMREMGGVLEIRVSNIELHAACAAYQPNLPPGAYVRVMVRDTGVGMPADTVERIFEPFFTTKGIGEGTGLGMAIVHGIVISHGGGVTVDSTPGKGTIVSIYLPRLIDDAQSAMVSTHETPPGQGRILLVDDEEVLARLGQALLQRLGYEVVVCTSGLDALRLFQEEPHRFDVVITDQTMPAMTGATLIEELRLVRADIPIILCTGFSHLMSAEKAETLDVDAFVMKPGVTRELAVTIQQVLANRAQHKRSLNTRS
jgi:PAS domain S-box-containing protein